MIVHQSGLTPRCYAQSGYELRGLPRQQTSALAFGTLMHHVAQQFRRMVAEGTDFAEAHKIALESFAFYWSPLNIASITEPIPADGWLTGQTYAGLRKRGLEMIQRLADLTRYDEGELLALEYGFIVPIDGTWDEDLGKPHELAGTVDQLTLRHFARHLTVSIDDYKPLALTTPLPTPSGWTTMGAVQVGEQVLGADGRPCTVTAKSSVHLDRDCFRIVFDDGTDVIAASDHLWQVDVAQRGPEVLSTEQMREQLWSTATKPQRQLRITNTEPLVLAEQALSPHPYVLGAWLGDGRTRDGSISKPEPELFEHIEACGYEVRPPQPSDPMTRTVRGLGAELGTLRGDKHIPKEYLRGSLGQRLALLQGLMDTDGSWNRKRHQAVFTTVDKQLAEDVRELVISLGAKARIWECQRKGFGLTVTAYDVTFSPIDWNPFRLSRKADLVRPGKTRARRRLVVSIEPVVGVPTQCIAVDSTDHLFLCGEQMLPTHNTGVVGKTLRYSVQFSAYTYASTKREFWVGYGGEDGFGEERGNELYERLQGAARRGNWIDLRTGKFVDAGFRGPIDYQRFALAVEQYTAMAKADIWPLTLSGDTCPHCPYRAVCGGTGIAPKDHGDPRSKK